MIPFVISVCECMVCVKLCQCQSACSHRHNRLLNPSGPLFDPALLLATETELGVTYSNMPPLTVLCSFCICIQIKTMASTSSVSQVSAWTWSWDNLPRSSFLVHQLRVSVWPSWVSFTFSHLLRTFIIQIRVLSRKTDGRRDDGSLPLLSMCITLSNKEGTNCIWGSVYIISHLSMESLPLQVRKPLNHFDMLVYSDSQNK